MDLSQEVKEEQINAIEQLVMNAIPGATCKRTPNLLLFTLPLSSTNKFPGVLRHLP